MGQGGTGYAGETEGQLDTGHSDWHADAGKNTGEPQAESGRKAAKADYCFCGRFAVKQRFHHASQTAGAKDGDAVCTGCMEF